MQVWMWWPIRFWIWITGYKSSDCSLGVGRSQIIGQPFIIAMFNDQTFYWHMTLSEEQMIKTIANMQEALDQYQIFKRDKDEPKPGA